MRSGECCLALGWVLPFSTTKGLEGSRSPERWILCGPCSSTWMGMPWAGLTLSSTARQGGTPCYPCCTPTAKIKTLSRGKMEVRLFKVKKFCLTFHVIAQKNYFLKLINHMHSPHMAVSLPKQIAFIVKTTNLGTVIDSIVLWAVRKGTWRCSFAWLCRNKDWSGLLVLLDGCWADSHRVYKAQPYPPSLFKITLSIAFPLAALQAPQSTSPVNILRRAMLIKTS